MHSATGGDGGRLIEQSSKISKKSYVRTARQALLLSAIEISLGIGLLQSTAGNTQEGHIDYVSKLIVVAQCSVKLLRVVEVS